MAAGSRQHPSRDIHVEDLRRIEGNVPYTKTVVTPAAHPPVSNQTVLTPALYQPQRKIQTVQPAVPVVIVGAALAVLVMVLYFFQREEEA